MNCNPTLPWDFNPRCAVQELDLIWHTQRNPDQTTHYNLNGYNVKQHQESGAKKCKERAHWPAICPRSAIQILQALQAADGVTQEDKVRFGSTIIAWQMYSMCPTRTPCDFDIVKSNVLSKEDALLDAQTNRKNIIFLDLENEAVYIIVMDREDRPYGGYVGVLRNAPSVFDAYHSVDSFYLPFGMFAPLAAVVHRPEDVVFHDDGSVYATDVEEVIQTMLDDATFADPISRKRVYEAVRGMKGKPIYFPHGGLLRYLRGCVVMDAFFGINLTRSQLVALNIRRGHRIAAGNARSYIHNSILVVSRTDPFKFGVLKVVTIKQYGPLDWRMWVACESNDSNHALFPQLIGPANDFEFLDGHFNPISIT